MASQEYSEGLYRVIEVNSETGDLLLNDTERNERVRVNGRGYSIELQQEIDELEPGYLIRGALIGDSNKSALRNIEYLTVHSTSTLHLTDQIAEIPIPVADDVWSQFNGEGSVVTTVNDDDTVVYDLELFPTNREGQSIYEAVQSGDRSIEPWFESLPASEQEAAHLLVVNPQKQPYTAIVGFPESHQAYDNLRDRLQQAETRYNGTDGRTQSGEAERGESGTSNTTERDGHKNSSRRDSSDSRETYTIRNVTVKPAPSTKSAAFEYSDLDRGPEATTLTRALHAVYWSIYLFLVFPFQYIIRSFMWNFWNNWSVKYKIRRLSKEGVLNIKKLKFLFNTDRRRVYLRASRLYTPPELWPFSDETAPISEDSGVESEPRPRNWDTIRRNVYDRDGYRCVNCGRSGGQNGDAILDADHVLPRSKGGPDQLENLRTLCRHCHQARHARIFE